MRCGRTSLHARLHNWRAVTSSYGRHPAESLRWRATTLAIFGGSIAVYGWEAAACVSATTWTGVEPVALQPMTLGPVRGSSSTSWSLQTDVQ